MQVQTSAMVCVSGGRGESTTISKLNSEELDNTRQRIKIKTGNTRQKKKKKKSEDTKPTR